MQKERIVGWYRVSTPDQEDKGSSLEVQKNAIKAAVARRSNAVLVGFYGGQETGAEGLKPEFHRLLRDARGRKIYDGVMCADLTRFSRNMKDSLAALDVFEEYGIKLYVLDSEINLDEPDDLLQVDLHMAIGQHYARKQKRKSIDTRILRAKQGLPSAGRPPYGRKFNRETKTWSVDPTAKKLMERVAKLYLSGKTYTEISQQLPGTLDENTIRRRLLASGATWVQKFMVKGKQITIPTHIEPLLPQEILDRIEAQARNNRLDTKRKRISPVAHLARCANCGSVLSAHALSGTTWEYYRHHPKTKKPGCMVAVRADVLEAEVLAQLWTLLRKDMKGLRASIESALNAANEDRVELQTERAERMSKLAGLEKENNHIIQSVAKSGPAMAVKLNERFEKNEATMELLRKSISELDAKLATVEVPADLPDRVDALLGKLTKYGGPMHWSREQQKELCLLMMGGPVHWRRPEDKDRGIFIEQVERDGEKVWRYKLRGALVLAAGTVGAASVEADDAARFGPEGRIPAATALAALANEVQITYSAQRKATLVRL